MTRPLAMVAMLGALGGLGCGTSPEFVDDVDYPSGHADSGHADSGHADKMSVVRVRPADGGDRALLAGLVGRWAGVGHQSDGATWEMEVDVTRLDEGPCAIVRYPELGCSGYWECLGSAGRRLRAIERITVGSDTCVDRVRVDLRLEKGRQAAAFTAKTRDIGAAGRLQRVTHR